MNWSRTRVWLWSLSLWASAACGGSAPRGEPQGETVCSAMFNNNCNRGCECPEQYECYVVDKGGLGTGAGENYCLKPCETQADCPESKLCVAALFLVTGGGDRVEGQCLSPCENDTCPQWGTCHTGALYPEQTEARRVCSKGSLP